MSRRWTDQFLAEMQQHGDPLADAAVEALYAGGNIAAVQGVMNMLVTNDQPPPDALPAAIRDYLAQTGAVPALDLPEIEKGEKVFADNGPEVLAVLLCGSLPAAYGCWKGVKVLYATGYLEKRPNRRVVETAQMVIDVMSPGGLGPTGRGIRSAQKVRLMHAAVRRLILHGNGSAPGIAWDVGKLGIPINQLDLIGTLMTFSFVILEGLAKFDIVLPTDQQQSYLDAWVAVGRLMGIRPDLLPANLAEADELTNYILSHELAPSDEGRAMTSALLDVINQNVPLSVFDGFAPAVIRHLLPADLADGLGVPVHRIDERIVSASAPLVGWLAGETTATQRRAAVFRTFAMHLVQWMITVDRGGERTNFEIPIELRRQWGPDPKEESFARHLGSWLLRKL